MRKLLDHVRILQSFPRVLYFRIITLINVGEEDSIIKNIDWQQESRMCIWSRIVLAIDICTVLQNCRIATSKLNSHGGRRRPRPLRWPLLGCWLSGSRGYALIFVFRDERAHAVSTRITYDLHSKRKSPDTIEANKVKAMLKNAKSDLGKYFKKKAQHLLVIGRAQAKIQDGDEQVIHPVVKVLSCSGVRELSPAEGPVPCSGQVQGRCQNIQGVFAAGFAVFPHGTSCGSRRGHDARVLPYLARPGGLCARTAYQCTGLCYCTVMITQTILGLAMPQVKTFLVAEVLALSQSNEGKHFGPAKAPLGTDYSAAQFRDWPEAVVKAFNGKMFPAAWLAEDFKQYGAT